MLSVCLVGALRVALPSAAELVASFCSGFPLPDDAKEQAIASWPLQWPLCWPREERQCAGSLVFCRSSIYWFSCFSDAKATSQLDSRSLCQLALRPSQRRVGQRQQQWRSLAKQSRFGRDKHHQHCLRPTVSSLLLADWLATGKPDWRWCPLKTARRLLADDGSVLRCAPLGPHLQRPTQATRLPPFE